MQMIVAADENWGIGSKGGLLVRIPADMKQFQQETIGKIVVMGRKTLESLPGAQPLSGRTNLVLTHNRGYKIRGAELCYSVEEVMARICTAAPEDIYIIGGQSIYEQFLPYTTTIHVTRLMYSYEADTYFPNLEKSKEWVKTAESEEQTYFDLEYFFQKYERKT